jgi:Glycosyl hydrolase family 12/Cellulose binding domain
MMFKRLRTLALAVLLVAGTAVTAVITAPAASAAVICDQFGSTTIQGGRYVIQNNRWGSDAPQCISTTTTGFSITQQDGVKATNGAPNSYPSVYYGCHYANCSSSGNILPLQASTSAFNGISTSVSMTYPSSGIWDAAYDIWFDPTPRTDGQNTGAEIMVWLNRMGSIQPVGSQVATVSLAGATWAVWEGNIGWNVVSYVRSSPTTSMNFPVSTFFNDAVSRGFAQRSWYLTSIQAGFEPWQGGVGLAVNNFSVTTGGGGTTTTTTQPSSSTTSTTRNTTTTTTGGGTRSCAATWSVQSQWQDGFVANLTIRNTGGSSINSWTLSWTFPGNQRIVGTPWGLVVTQNGQSVTARNASYNGQIPVNGSTTGGFQATYSGTNSPPSSIGCTAA